MRRSCSKCEGRHFIRRKRSFQERLSGITTTLRPFRCSSCGQESLFDVHERDLKDKLLIALLVALALLLISTLLGWILFD